MLSMLSCLEYLAVYIMKTFFGLLAINLEIIGLTFLREHGIILGCAASHPTLSFGKLILTMLRLNIH